MATIDNAQEMRALLPEPGWPRADGLRLGDARRARARVAGILTSPDALLAAALLLLGVRLLTVLPQSFSIDSWLELATGRLIWHVGIPHYETLTTVAHAKPWIDQQWLAQLLGYGLYRAGGLGLLGLTNVTLLVSGLSLAVITARRLGASLRDVLIPVIFCGWLFIPGSEVRTQAFAVPLFALTVFLLALDSRNPSRRVYWTLPILVLWANLHGTASLGAGLVALRGLTLAWEQRCALRGSPARAVRPLVLALGGPLTLLVTPYGIQSIAYYESTLGNSAFHQMVTEWQPITTSLVIAVPFFLIAGVTIWSFGRYPDRSTLWERVALIVLMAASISVIRNVVFFALAALAILPLSLGGISHRKLGRPAGARRRVNLALVVGALALTAATVGVTLERRDASLEGSYHRPALLAAIERAMRADPSLKLADDTRYGDWLLWTAPGLAGRVAYDARYELYSSAQLTELEKLLGAAGPGWKRVVDGYRLLVLNRSADSDSVAAFLREPGARVMYSDSQAVVILRSRAEA